MDKLKQRERSSSSSIIYDISNKDNTLYSSYSYNDHPYHNDNPFNNISISISRLNANDIKRRDIR